MNVKKTSLSQFLGGPRQFSIPIYQRPYAWDDEQCERLWQDVVRAAKNRSSMGHFIGSIVCIDEGANNPSSVQEYQIVDGQQRLTTISLMLLAIADAGDDLISDGDRNKIRNRYLLNSDEDGDKRHKLVLTERDRDAMFALIDGDSRPETHSRIADNYDFFTDKISRDGADLSGIREGILNLSIVDIALNRSEDDDPQLIFESLNSTGRKLRAADHIRNHILMNLESAEQEKIYKSYWRPMEIKFDKDGDLSEFDDFVKDYLVMKAGSDVKKSDVYEEFKGIVRKATSNRALVEDMHHFADLYIRLAHSAEPDDALRQKTEDVKVLGKVSYPLLLEVYHDYTEGKIVKEDVIEVFALVESYSIRRAVCSMPSNAFNKMFARLAGEIDKENYLESFKAALGRKQRRLRFPSDDEFVKELRLRDLYNMRTLPKHLLNKLENHGCKERVDVSDAKIEHIMPQNLGKEWKRDLGEDWERVHVECLHTLGNLTLTGYNSELGNRPFAEKRDMSGGYSESPFRLNADLKSAEKWGEEQMRDRAERLALRACEIWKYPTLPADAKDKYAKYDDEEYDEDDGSRTWDEAVRTASPDNRRAVEALIVEIQSKFDCFDETRKNGLRHFYAKRPLSREHCFAVVRCGKNVSRVSFRIDPDSFEDGDNIDKVAGWFFPRGTERRMRVKAKSVEEIIRMLEHAYGITAA